VPVEKHRELALIRAANLRATRTSFTSRANDGPVARESTPSAFEVVTVECIEVPVNQLFFGRHIPYLLIRLGLNHLPAAVRCITIMFGVSF